MTAPFRAKAALIVGGALLPLALLEGIARLWTPPAIPSLAIFRPAPGVGYELHPGRYSGPRGEEIRIDSAGLRSGSEEGAPQDGSLVLALGDSFVFGLGVAHDETFPAALERELPGTRVLNAGVPGYNLRQNVARLEALLRDIEPQTIVLGFLENDLHNPSSPDHEATSDGTLRQHPLAYRPDATVNPFVALTSSGPWLWLQVHSAAFRVLSWELIRRRLEVAGAAELAARARATERSPELGDRLLRGESDPETERRFQAAAALLERAAALARAADARLLIVVFPRPEQLVSDELRGGNRRIVRIARDAGIEVVDPTAALAAQPDHLGLFLFPEDHHPSARGYALIAAEVAEILQAERAGQGPAGD